MRMDVSIHACSSCYLKMDEISVSKFKHSKPIQLSHMLGAQWQPWLNSLHGATTWKSTDEEVPRVLTQYLIDSGTARSR
jgi:hypothetical protein